jgi:hypothetical protein
MSISIPQSDMPLADRPAARSRSPLRVLPFTLPLIVVAVGWLIGASVSVEGDLIAINLASEQACARPFDEACLMPSAEVASAYTDKAACDKPTKIVCLIPMGATSKDAIDQAARQLSTDLGLAVGVLPPIAVPEDAYNADRGQFDPDKMMDAMEATYASVQVEAGSLLLMVTPVDIYMPSARECLL